MVGTDILKYVFVVAGIVGGISAVRRWRMRRRQMKALRAVKVRRALPTDEG